MIVKDVGLANFTGEVMNYRGGPVLVDFYGTYCPPCRKLKPVLDALARDGHKVVAVNVEEEPELAEHYGVEAVPTLFAFVGGHPVVKAAGMKNKEQLAEMLALAVQQAGG